MDIWVAGGRGSLEISMDLRGGSLWVFMDIKGAILDNHGHKGVTWDDQT
jgi:hypothetical protein